RAGCRTTGGPSTCASTPTPGRRRRLARSASTNSTGSSAEGATTMQDLRVGLIGCGFMGRTHSNAYRRLNNFFPVQHRPVLQAACGRDRERTEAFARIWGYARAETDWRRLVEAKGID